MTPQQLGERIRQAREAKGWSQEELAERIARDQRSVSEYENGKRRIYAHDLPTIAQALDIPLMALFEDVLSKDDLDLMLLREFHRLDYPHRQTALEILRMVASLVSDKR